jgi:hypothetical protein
VGCLEKDYRTEPLQSSVLSINIRNHSIICLFEEQQHRFVNVTIYVRRNYITLTEHCTKTATTTRRIRIKTHNKKISLVFYNLMELGNKV